MHSDSSAVLIDSHVHIDDERLSPDRLAVLDAARKHNIAAQIVPAVSQRLWPRLKNVCDEHDDLFPCYGLHPCFCDEHTDAHLQELALWLGREPTVAVGECGLDYAVAGANKAQQQHLFAAQLALAREFNLPVVIHAVRAVEDVIRMIRASGHYNGMVHSFNGSEQQAKRLIDLGYSMSFGGAITNQRAKRLQTLVQNLPLDAMLLETDAPDQAPASVHGQRNEPAYLVDIFNVLCTLRSESPAIIANTTTANAMKLFDLPIGAPSKAKKAPSGTS